MSRTPESNMLRQISQPVLVTALVASLAAGLGGCSSSSKSGSSKSFETSGLASQSTARIAPEATVGQYTAKTYTEEASVINLPDQWLSEAQYGTATVEARRAAAEAAKLQASAGSRESFAAAETALSEAYSMKQTELARAQMMSGVYDAQLGQQRTEIEARQHAFESEARRREAFLASSISEWQAEVERMRSAADAAWMDSVARHEKLVAERHAVGLRGQATIDQMVQVADLTAQRAAEKVTALRTEAESVTENTQAQVSELNATIASVSQQTAARVGELRQQAESLREETISIVTELNAEADAMTLQDVEGEYGLALRQAQVSFDGALTEAGDLRSLAVEKRMLAAAESQRRLAELRQSEENTRAAYEEAMTHIASTLEKTRAAISVKRAEAERIEKTARGAFVQAEVDAKAKAVIAESTHQRELAEQQFQALRAEAEAEAAALQAKLYRQIAKEMKAGKVALKPQTGKNSGVPASTEPTPEFQDAAAKTPVVEPDRIAQFKTALAEVTKIRVQADADEAEALAMRDAETGQFNAWLEESSARHAAWQARIDAFGRQSDAEIASLLSRAEAVVVSAEAARERSFVHAESDKQGTMARIVSLKAKASATEKKNFARVEQLLAQAETTARNGDSEVRTLEVRRDSTLRRGTARSRALLAEAEALDQSQRAVVSRMQSEIDSARKILASEMRRLDQSAETFIAVAKANHDEQKVLADTFERISVANATELTATHIASNKQADASVEYLRRVVDANALSAGAEVDRMVADASAKLGFQEAANLAYRGEIEAREQIALAAAGEQRAIADAQEQVVRSRFDSRVASTLASRDRAYAEVYLNNFQQDAKTRQAFADAARFDEMASAALQRLNAAARSFGRTADENWDARLAMPGTFPVPRNSDELYRKASERLNGSVFVNVDLD